MSNELEPLMVTLEEAMVVLLDEGLRFAYFGGNSWSVKTIDLDHYKGTGPNWWTAASRALGRKVVPRSQEAEMRAALAELVRLKDGPRDDAYRRDKEAAWEKARSLIGRNS